MSYPGAKYRQGHQAQPGYPGSQAQPPQPQYQGGPPPAYQQPPGYPSPYTPVYTQGPVPYPYANPPVVQATPMAPLGGAQPYVPSLSTPYGYSSEPSAPPPPAFNPEAVVGGSGSAGAPPSYTQAPPYTPVPVGPAYTPPGAYPPCGGGGGGGAQPVYATAGMGGSGSGGQGPPVAYVPYGSQSSMAPPSGFPYGGQTSSGGSYSAQLYQQQQQQQQPQQAYGQQGGGGGGMYAPVIPSSQQQQPSPGPRPSAPDLPPGYSMYDPYAPNRPPMQSSCSGRKRALFIGICYRGSRAELRGCVNDVKSLHQFITRTYGFKSEDCRILTDDQSFSEGSPTRHNIIEGMRWLVHGARPGDSLFLHYSGHGGSRRDTDGDEADGMDETILPLDFERAGEILDDEIHNLVVRPLVQGVRLTAVFDSCHSGSVMDLPYSYKVDGSQEIVEIDNTKRVFESLANAGMAYLMGNRSAALGLAMEGLGSLLMGPRHNKDAQKRSEREKATPADVIQFSGCRDDQTSADAMIAGRATGAMSDALVTALSQDPHQNYGALLKNMRQILKGKYSQVPQLSSGHKMDLRAPFDL